MRQRFQFECISGEFVVRLITGGPHNLCVQPMLFYSKCSGFTVCLAHSDISLSMYINQC